MNKAKGWIRTTLGEIATLVKGISYASEDYCSPGDGAVFITIKCVSKSGGFKSEGVKYYNGSITDSQVLQSGDILIANTDLTRAGDIVGCPIMIPAISNQTITMSMDLSKLVEDDSRIDRNFLYYKLMTDPVRRFMKNHASGSTVLHLQTRAVPSLVLEIPTSKTEQTKIAEILSTVDRAIEQTEALITKQQRIKTGLMQDILTHGIDEHGNIRSEETHQFKDSPLGRIPVEWEVKQLSEITSIKGGKRLPVGHSYTEEDNGYRYLRVLDFFECEIDYESLVLLEERTFNALGMYEIYDGQLCVSIAGSLGYFSVFRPPSGIRAILTENAAKIVLEGDDVIPEYLSAVLNSHTVQNQIEAEKGTGGGVPKLALFRIQSLLLALPFKKEEQKRILMKLETLRQIIKNTNINLHKLHSLKTALMQDLLTGKVRVTPLLDETEVIKDDSGQNTPVHQDRRAQPCGETSAGSACGAGVGDR